MNPNGKRRDTVRSLRGDRKRRSTKTDRRLSHHRARQKNRARLHQIDLTDPDNVGYDPVPYSRDRIFDPWGGIHDYGVNVSVFDRVVDHLMDTDPCFAADAPDGRRAKIIARYGNSTSVRQACEWHHLLSEPSRLGYPRLVRDCPRGPEADLLVVTSNGAEQTLNRTIRSDAHDQARYGMGGYTLGDPWSLGIVEPLWVYRGDRTDFIGMPEGRNANGARERWDRAMRCLADVAHEIVPDPNYRTR